MAVDPVILTQDGGALLDGWNEGCDELTHRLFYDVPNEDLNGFEVILGHVLERFGDNQSLDR